MATITPIASTGLNALLNETGKIYLSVDGNGTTGSTGVVQVLKNSGATVRKAYLVGSGTYGSIGTTASVNGTAIGWDRIETTPWGGGTFYSYLSDVTSIVKSTIDSAATGTLNIAVNEGTESVSYEGLALAVLFDNPSQTTDQSVILYFGGLKPTGDTATINFGAPVNTSAVLAATLGLGIGFSYNSGTTSEQVSVVKVNNQLLTSVAGNADDGALENSALFTVGGLGDSTNNPSPTSTNPTTDDELYNLLPFIKNGDTSLTLNTVDPSNTDHIFFAHLTLQGITGTVATPVVTLSVSPASVAENGTPNLVYTFTRTGATTSALTVNYSVGGTADNSDYTGTTTGSKTITFAAGSTTATLTVDPTADTTVEPDETVALTLVSGTGYAIGTSTAVVGTIANDDLPSVTLVVSPNSVLEDGTTNLVYTLTRTGATTNPLTVNFNVLSTATLGTDFTQTGAVITGVGTTGTVTFAAVSSTAIVTLDPIADTIAEPNETIAVTLAAGTGYTIGTTIAVTGTITNDDIGTSLITTDLTSTTPTQLVNTLLGSGGTASNITFTGANVAGGLFSGGLAAGIGIDSGIILSTGDVSFAKGPNDSSSTTGNNAKAGDTDLNAIVNPLTTNDAAVLEFDFIPTSSTVSFSYVFASEEYYEYVNSNYNDVFAFYVNGKNIALIPGTTTPVAINTVNAGNSLTPGPGINSTFFVPNYGTAFDTQFDGFTKVLSATATGLVTGVAAKIKLAIADTSDSSLDSAVFIQASSLGNSTLVTVTATDSDAGEGATPNLGVFTLTRTGSTTAPLTVSYTISGTASSADYSAIPATVTIPAGQASTTVTVTPIDDLLLEGNETVVLSLIDTSNYDLGVQNSATVIVADNEVQSAVVTLEVSPVSVAENGTTNLLYTFTRTGSTTSPLTVNYSVGGAASFGTDYTQTGASSFSSVTGSITFATGSTTAVLTVDPTADTILEGNETVALTLASGTGYTIGTATTVTGIILDDDTPVITVAVAPASVLEDGTPNLVYTFTRTGSTTSPLTVNYGVSGTATLNTDYVQTGAATFSSTSGSITFAAGSSTATLVIDPTVDTTVEVDETIAVTLAPNANYAIGTSTAVTGTIANDDSSKQQIVALSTPNNLIAVGQQFTVTVSYSASDANKLLGGVGFEVHFDSTKLQLDSITPSFTTSLFGTPSSGVETVSDSNAATDKQINWQYVDFGASWPNQTLPLTLGTLTFKALAATSASSLNVTVSTPATGYTGQSTSLPLTLFVAPTLAIAPTTVTQNEGNSGNTPFTFTVTRSGDTSLASSASFAVTGSGTNPANAADFGGALPTGTVNFAAGETTKTITVNVSGDSIFEANETFNVTLSNPTGAVLSTASTATGTITNDDAAPVFAIASASANEGGAITFTVTRTGDAQATQAVTVATSIGASNTASATDFTANTGTVSFAQGETSKTFTVQTTQDTLIEGNETFTVALTNPTNGATLSATNSSATGTIINDDLGLQQITSAANLKTRQGQVISIPLFYNTSTADNTLPGIGLRLHYNSASLSFKDVTNLFSNSIFGTVSDAADTANFDGNTSTDRFVQLQYLDFAGNWPNQTLPLKLGDFNFTAQTGFNGTQLNVTSPDGTLATGYSLKADPLLVAKQPWNFDIDGDGKVGALSDGIIAVRYLFGSAFAGNALIAGAISPTATRSLSEIQAYLQEGVTQKYLDIDGNGSVGALSDGIIAVRYLFGSAFAGNALIDGAIAPDATRNLAGIQSYLSGLTTLT